MQNPDAMCRLDCARYLNRGPKCVGNREPLRAGTLEEVEPGVVLHHQVRPTIGSDPGVIDADDVRVRRYPRHQIRFRRECGHGDDVSDQNLDSNPAAWHVLLEQEHVGVPA